MFFKKVGWNCNMLCHHCHVSRKNFFDDPRMSAMGSCPRRTRENFAADVASSHQQQKRALSGQQILVKILTDSVSSRWYGLKAMSQPLLCLRLPVGGGWLCAGYAPVVLPPYPESGTVHLDSSWCHDDLYGKGGVSSSAVSVCNLSCI